MPKTLIVPLDGSRLAERGLARAQELALHLETCDIVVMTASTAGDSRRREYVETVAELSADSRVSAEYIVGDPAASLGERGAGASRRGGLYDHARPRRIHRATYWRSDVIGSADA